MPIGVDGLKVDFVNSTHLRWRDHGIDHETKSYDEVDVVDMHP